MTTPQYNNKRMALAMAIAALGSLVTGCGSSGPTTGIPQTTYPNGVPGIPGGCIPIAQQIGFSGTNIYFDSANIVGGTIPNSTTPVGQMVVTAGSAGGPYTRTGVDGTISMNAQPMGQAQQTPYPGYPTGTYPNPYGTPSFGQLSKTANVQGFVQISPQTQSDIMFQVQSGRIQIPYTGTTAPTVPQPGMPGYNPYQPYNPYQQPYAQQQICVSGIAMNVGHYYNTIYGGNVYLYLNGTNHGYALYF